MQGNRIILGRPTINVAGKEHIALTEGLLSLLITENTSGLYRCEATFGNWGDDNAVGYLYFDRTQLDFGTSLQVQYGADTLFDGRIMGLEGHFPLGEAPSIAVLAEDRFQDLRMTRRTRTFLDTTDADVMNKIVADYSLTPDINITGTQHKILAQLNQSDLAFLRDRARALDAELWIADGTLHVVSHASRVGDGQTVAMAYGHDLRSFSVLADLAGQRSSITVSGWSVADKDVAKYAATVEAISSELNGGTSGVSILESALAERKESLLHTVPLSLEEAQYRAEAYFKLSARRFVVGHGVAEANGTLRVGNTVNLNGLGTLFSGKYYLSEVTHIFDGVHGIRTEFTAERPSIGRT
ncbi:MAG: phage late control D family protein [Ktedonobacteraceae bacterium]